MKFKDFKKQLLRQDERLRKEYQSRDLSFEVGDMIIEARIIKGLTQKKLADLMDTKQSSIARSEGGTYLPSLGFLQKMAEALGTYLVAPRFAFLERETSYYESEMVSSHEIMQNSGISWVSWAKEDESHVQFLKISF